MIYAWRKTGARRVQALCWTCRKRWRAQPFRFLPAVCPQCGAGLTVLSSRFRAPPMRDRAAWTALRDRLLRWRDAQEPHGAGRQLAARFARRR